MARERWRRATPCRFGRTPRVALGALTGAAGLAAICGRAWADSLPLTMSYTAPVECPSEDAIRAAVARLVTKQKANEFSARVLIEAGGGEYTAQIVSSDGTERALTGQTCAAVAEAVEVVLALAISPSSGPRAESGAETNQDSTIPAKPVARVDTPVHPARTDAEPPFARVMLGAGAAADWGTLPRIAGGLSGRVGLTSHVWSAVLDGTYWFEQRGLAAGSSTVGGDFTWWTVRPGGCAAALLAPIRLALCVGPELGRLNGRGVVASARDAGTFWLAVDAWAELGLPISQHWRARAGLGLAVPIIGRRPFQLNGIPGTVTIHQPAAVSGQGELGLDFVF